VFPLSTTRTAAIALSLRAVCSSAACDSPAEARSGMMTSNPRLRSSALRRCEVVGEPSVTASTTRSAARAAIAASMTRATIAPRAIFEWLVRQDSLRELGMRSVRVPEQILFCSIAGGFDVAGRLVGLDEPTRRFDRQGAVGLFGEVGGKPLHGR